MLYNYNNTTASRIQYLKDNRMGFVQDTDMDQIIKENHFQLILVRCGNGRFIVPAQDAKHFIDIIEKSGSDYIRDVSLYFQK